MRTLTAAQVAAELGRSKEWLYDNHARLAREKKMPPPVSEGGTLAWSAAQFYAWLDRTLPKELRQAAAAFRAAYAAAESAYAGHRPPAGSDADIERWKDQLDRRFAGTKGH